LHLLSGPKSGQCGTQVPSYRATQHQEQGRERLTTHTHTHTHTRTVTRFGGQVHCHWKADSKHCNGSWASDSQRIGDLSYRLPGLPPLYCTSTSTIQFNPSCRAALIGKRSDLLMGERGERGFATGVAREGYRPTGRQADRQAGMLVCLTGLRRCGQKQAMDGWYHRLKRVSGSGEKRHMLIWTSVAFPTCNGGSCKGSGSQVRHMSTAKHIAGHVGFTISDVHSSMRSAQG
jgi:hypothetical protein